MYMYWILFSEYLLHITEYDPFGTFVNLDAPH